MPMPSRTERDAAALLALPLVALACCVGLPLLASIGVGAFLWLAGAGLPLAIAVVFGGLVVGLVWRRRRRPGRAAAEAARADRR